MMRLLEGYGPGEALKDISRLITLPEFSSSAFTSEWIRCSVGVPLMLRIRSPTCRAPLLCEYVCVCVCVCGCVRYVHVQMYMSMSGLCVCGGCGTILGGGCGCGCVGVRRTVATCSGCFPEKTLHHNIHNHIIACHSNNTVDFVVNKST